MKRSILVVVVASLVVTAGLAATAVAALNTGRLVSYSDGKLVIKHRTAGKSTYRVNSKTDCGVSYGSPPQSGDSIPCRTLGREKYEGKPVRVTWHRQDDRRIADVVAVNLPNG
jgi:hypothetical protein